MQLNDSKHIYERAQQLAPELIAFRRDLHRFPELSCQESRTASKIVEELRKLGLEPVTGVGGHGLYADLIGSEPGPTIALRADIDALPIVEDTQLPFSSENPGVMHACGHDAHTTVLLGAVHILVGMKDRLAGRVRFLFQAAEEILVGAKDMIADGVLEGVDEIYGLHNEPKMPAGLIGTRYGSTMGSTERIEITITGKGGHAAMPEQCIDPIVAASAVVMGLQSAISREMSAFDPAVITIGSFQAGFANNVISNEAVLLGTVRTFSPEVQVSMPERIERIVSNISTAYRCESKVNVLRQVPVLVNHDSCVKHVEEVIDQVLGREHRVDAKPTLGGEDFALYLEQRPGCFFWLGSGPRENAEQAYGLHHAKYVIDEACIPLGSSVLAGIAFRKLSKP